MRHFSLTSYERKALVTIILLATSGVVATDIYIPSLPHIQKLFSTTEALMQMTLSIFLIFFALSPLVYGPLSDKVGRKKIAIFGLVIGMIGSTLALISWNIICLFIARATQGIGLGAGMFLFRVIMRDLFSGDKMAYYTSFITISYSAMLALAPFLGGLFEHYLSWRISFLFSIIYMGVALVVLIYWLKESNQHLNPKALKPSILTKNYHTVIRNPIFLGYAFCSMASFATIGAFLAETPFLLERVLGLSALQYGALSIFPAIALCLGGFANGFLLRRIGRHRTLVLGSWILFIAALLLALFYVMGFLNIFVILLPMTLSYLAASFIFANAVAGGLAPFAHIAGSAGALYSAFQVSGGFLGSTVMTFFPKTTQFPLAIVVLSLSIIGYIAQKIAFIYAQKQAHH